ncbi:CAP domain-containing protein [Paludisphaera sp.]|uniref:CAP domain-containing protein n=1 Tax=Paludisphaera sp. TaxID=2017432 RepID=UPI00301DBC58
MARPTSRRSLRFEGLEDRQLLSSAVPNNEQQLALSLINLARTNPQAASQWMGSVGSDVKRTLDHYNVDVDAVKATVASSRALPPVAWNPDLAEAAQAHSEDMAANKYQSHTGSDGSSPEDRMKRAGFNGSATAENAYAYAKSVDNATQAFMYDWGVADAGHRRNLIQPGVAPEASFTDVGVGVTKTTGKIGPVVVTQNFGRDASTAPKVVGVVYHDNDGDDFYTPGEGKGGVAIDATNVETGQTASTRSWESGGYQIPLSAGRYKVTASENDVVIKEVEVTVSNLNVAQDFVTSKPWDGRLRTAMNAANQVKASTTAAAQPVSLSADVKRSEPVVKTNAPVVVKESTKPASPPKMAVFTPADWKGPDVAASALAAWSTWKAKSV